ncbi:MAG TPA: CYTH domain-containing protein [Deltaproteobacteria bacterium]|nr:CYTH domain-containing protein [Deltaproteobacteria bacterium]
MTVEIETTLCVIHDDPVGIMENISRVRALGPYRFTPRGTQTLQDVYYDTPSRILSSRGIAVRTRGHGATAVFCIKQDEQVDASGTAVRDEIEMPWSRQCLDHIAHILHKVAYGLVEVPCRTDDPVEGLACLGLSPIQSRRTVRLTLDAGQEGDPCLGTLAKLALDRVCYRFSGSSILHHEIEIEAACPESLEHVRELSILLMNLHPDALRPWRHNKLVTGFALERLLAEGSLAITPGRYNSLAGPAYRAIETILHNA